MNFPRLVLAAAIASTGCGARTSLGTSEHVTPDAAVDAAAAAAADASACAPSCGDKACGADDGCGSPCACVESTVLFGGLGDVPSATNGFFGDTWAWDGAAWKQLEVSGPTARYIGAAAPGDSQALFFGGVFEQQGGTPLMLSDTWTWKGGAWTKLATSGPSGREYAAMGRLGDTVILFGGWSESAGTLGDMWIWDGKTWTQSTAAGPGPRAGAAMAELGGKLLLFGGYEPNTLTPVQDAWEWDGSSWTPSAAGPGPARARFGMATLGNRIVVFGGQSDACAAAPSPFCPDTWEWDGSTWTLASTSGPEPRADVAMASRSDSIVLFGGLLGDWNTGPVADTWVWNGSKWTDVTPTVSPSARSGALMVTPKP